MPKFHVKKTFELPERKLFVMAGAILEGDIQPGMFVHIPCNSSFAITAQIQGIETGPLQGVDEVHLCIESDQDGIDFLSAFNIRDETLDISTEGSD